MLGWTCKSGVQTGVWAADMMVPLPGVRRHCVGEMGHQRRFQGASPTSQLSSENWQKLYKSLKQKKKIIPTTKKC